MKIPEFTGKTYKSKSGKNWVDMNRNELWDEIVVLLVQNDRLTNKNKTRKKALKDMNRSILTAHHFRETLTHRVKMLESALDHWKFKCGRLEAELGDVVNRIVHDGVQVKTREGRMTASEANIQTIPKPGFIASIFGFKRKVTGVSGS